MIRPPTSSPSSSTGSTTSIRFRSLTEDDLRHIVDIQLERLRERLADRRLTLDVTEQAMQLLAHEGFDPAFGARPLKRVIQREIGDRAAVLILEGAVNEGGSSRVDVSASDDPDAACRGLSRATIRGGFCTELTRRLSGSLTTIRAKSCCFLPLAVSRDPASWRRRLVFPGPRSTDRSGASITSI